MHTKFFSRILAIFLVVTLGSCKLNTREKELKQRENILNQKEQELILREKILQLKEEELAKKGTNVDSTAKIDSMPVSSEALIGKWNVNMVCIEATCTGSAVGDTKAEQWVITQEGSDFIARVISGNKLLRVYSGIYTGNTLELIAQTEQNANEPPAKMVARLHSINPKKMEGQREITREKDCKIIYTMEMNKQ